MSLENRLRILPAGFLLKKYMEALEIPRNIELCNWIEALIAKLKNRKDRFMVTIMDSTVPPAFSWPSAARI